MTQSNTIAPSCTIIADASFCQTTKASGWGAWMVRSGLQAQSYGGPIKATVSGICDAEILALANALFIAERDQYAQSGSLVLLQSDSLVALGQIMRVVPSCQDKPHPKEGLKVNRAVRNIIRGDASDGLLFILTTVERLDLKLFVRHVRGHQEGGGRQWVNRRCDELAKRGMRTARARIRRVQHGKGREKLGT